jgi:hypothetical protein
MELQMNDVQIKRKSMDSQENSSEPPLKKLKMESNIETISENVPKSKEEILKIRESILNDLSKDVRFFKSKIKSQELFEEKWKSITKNYSSIYHKKKSINPQNSTFGKQKIVSKENPHLKNVKSTTLKDVQSVVRKNEKFGADMIKVDNVSSFVSGVFQKMYRVSPKFSETKKSFFPFFFKSKFNLRNIIQNLLLKSKLQMVY